MSRPPRFGVLRSGAAAGTLSFLLPGLGQAATGARRRGSLIALPVLALAAVGVATWLIDRRILVTAALTPATLLGLVSLSLVLLVYRSWAIVDAYRGGIGPRSRVAGAASFLVLAALLAVTAVSHGWVAYVGWSAHQTLTAVFSPDGPSFGGGPLPSESATPTPTPTVDPPTAEPTPSPSPTPVPTPAPTPIPDWAADRRLNVLLIGSDAGPGRWSLRADAIILVSVEIESGRVAAFSIPRYTTRVPLPEPAASAFECRCLNEAINALYVFANQNPGLFPGDEIRGFLALQEAIEVLAGVHLDGMAVADLNGFVRLVDAVGGVTIDAPAPVHDAEYPDPNGVDLVEVYFPAGEQRLDGWHALAYARTRHQDGDVARMQRQQIVVQALQQELSCDLLGNLTGVLDVARTSLWTTIHLDDVPEMLRIDPGPVESHVLFDIHNPALTADDVTRIQAAVAGAFDGPPPPDDEELDC